MRLIRTATTFSYNILIAGGDVSLACNLRELHPSWTVLESIEDAWQVNRVGVRACPIFAFVYWLLPDMAGIEACRRLRAFAGDDPMHITMVLDRDTPEARTRAIDAGAHDYLLPPLSPAIIADRVTRIASPDLRPMINAVLQGGGLRVDRQAFQVRHNGKIVLLSRGEFALLVHFILRPNRLMTREALAALSGKGGVIDFRTIDRNVARLRKSLASHAVPDPIRTIFGEGYVFDAAE